MVEGVFYGGGGPRDKGGSLVDRPLHSGFKCLDGKVYGQVLTFPSPIHGAISSQAWLAHTPEIFCRDLIALVD